MGRNLYLNAAIFMFAELMLASCAEKREEVRVDGALMTETLDFTLPMDTVSDAQIKNVRYLPLKGSEKYLLYRPTKLDVKDGKYFIGGRFDNKVVCYNEKGEFEYAIEASGGEPKDMSEDSEALREAVSYTVTSTSIYVLDNYNHKVNRYSIKDGKFISKTDINFVANAIEAFDDNNFLFSFIKCNDDPNGGPNIPAKDFAVWRTDSKMIAQEYYLPLPENYCQLGKWRWFTKHGDSIYFSYLKHDGYFTFKPDGEPTFTEIKFGNPVIRDYNNPKTLFEIDGFDRMTAIPFITDKYALMDIDKKDGESGYYLYDFDTKRFLDNSRTSKRFFQISGTDGNNFITAFHNKYELYDIIQHCGFPRADEETERLLANDGMALLIYEMK